MLNMYMKMTGAVLTVLSTTLFGISLAREKKANNERYKKASDWFELICERLKCGNTSVSDVLTECTKGYDGIIRKLSDEFVESLNNSDNKTMKEALEMCNNYHKYYRYTIEGQYLEEFAVQWDAAGVEGGLRCAERLVKTGNEKYTELSQDFSKDSKLLICAGGFAGVFAVLMLI